MTLDLGAVDRLESSYVNRSRSRDCLRADHGRGEAQRAIKVVFAESRGCDELLLCDQDESTRDKQRQLIRNQRFTREIARAFTDDLSR